MADSGSKKRKITKGSMEPNGRYTSEDANNLVINKQPLNNMQYLNGRDNYVESPMMKNIDPNLTNEALIIARLKADMSNGDNNAIASAYASTAQGASTIAAGVASSAQGISNIAAGTASTAQGYDTTASGLASTAQGIATNALEIAAIAEGQGTTASGLAAHAEGVMTTASGDASHAEGIGTSATNLASHAEGANTISSGSSAHAEGNETRATGLGSHAQNDRCIAEGDSSHAEGHATRASGRFTHSQGESTTAQGDISHAEGQNTVAQGIASHAQGQNTAANGAVSHAEGFGTTAQGSGSHAEGLNSAAIGDYSHAEGYLTRAVGYASHAEGEATIATGDNAHAEGLSTNTADQEGAHIMGQYGDARFPYSWHLANGTDENNRSLAAVIRNDGQGIADQGWVTGNADFAEMFETMSRESIPPGYFVTTKGDKIRKAGPEDDYILGVTSAAPAFLGDAEELRWKSKYVKDEWGRIKYRKVVIHEQKDKNGNVIKPERTEMSPVINPEWNSSEEYIPRSERPEWVPVALVGKVLVRDDGTCRADGYCMPGKGGIATSSSHGYRVLKRTGPKQVLIVKS